MSAIALKIQTTGLEQYAPGGQAVLKTMFIGGPGAGKTRLSSYWPKPLYADCEGGLSSIADRSMPFVTVSNSQDMLDLLSFLKLECRRPVADRQYRTVVIDTLDAFQRKVKDEWLQQNPGSQSFRGFDAWGYLDAKMQMLLTRLLNLDMNVIVCVHYKDKTIREGTGENATERQELMLQLSGDVKDNVFNDFDLVGWLGKYYEAVDGQRVEKRGLTFTSTPEKPFLKDRLHVTPNWMEVTFSDEDYAALFSAFINRLDDLTPSEDLGEIPSVNGRQAGGVVPPGASGPLPPSPPRPVDLTTLDKITLQKMARELGLKFQQNTIKAELVELINEAKQKPTEAAAAAPTEAPPESDARPASPAVAPPAPAKAQVAAPEPQAVAPEPAASATPVAPAPEPEPEPAVEVDDTPLALEEPPDRAPATPVPVTDIATEAGPVDPATGEILAPMTEAQVSQALGGQILSVTDTVDTPKMSDTPAAAPVLAAVREKTAAPAARPAAGRPANCEECGKSLAGENQDYVKLSQIKYRAYLCNEDYLARKAAS